MTIDVTIKSKDINDPALSLRDLDGARVAITAEITARVQVIKQQAAEAEALVGKPKRERAKRSDAGAKRVAVPDAKGAGNRTSALAGSVRHAIGIIGRRGFSARGNDDDRAARQLGGR